MRELSPFIGTKLIGCGVSITCNAVIQNNKMTTTFKIVKSICRRLDLIIPRKNKRKYESLITYVKDRPGHDLRYSLNSKKISNETGWKPRIKLNKGLDLTIKWYLENKDWWKSIRKNKYKGERLGV